MTRLSQPSFFYMGMYNLMLAQMITACSSVTTQPPHIFKRTDTSYSQSLKLTIVQDVCVHAHVYIATLLPWRSLTYSDVLEIAVVLSFTIYDKGGFDSQYYCR